MMKPTRIPIGHLILNDYRYGGLGIARFIYRDERKKRRVKPSNRKG